MATATHRWYSPHATKHGTVDITTVQSIAITKNWTRLAAQGDADLSDTFQAKTNLQVSGSIVIQDALQADGLLDAASATLTWKGTPEAGGVEKIETVTGVQFFSSGGTDAHNAIDTRTLGFNAFSPTGVDPHTTALGT